MQTSDASQQHVVINRYARRSGNLRPMDVATRLGRSVEHVLPFHNKVVASANIGRPFVMDLSRFSTLGRRLELLVRDIEQSAEVLAADSVASNGNR